jgi:hypothetical protein
LTLLLRISWCGLKETPDFIMDLLRRSIENMLAELGATT